MSRRQTTATKRKQQLHGVCYRAEVRLLPLGLTLWTSLSLLEHSLALAPLNELVNYWWALPEAARAIEAMKQAVAATAQP